jgi:hypothetical protein
VSVILAIDPGPHESAWLLYNVVKEQPYSQGWGFTTNDNVLDVIKNHASMAVAPRASILAVEMIQHYGTGMPAGAEIFDTCVWIGRFIETWRQHAAATDPFHLVKRIAIKMYLCGSVRTKDANVRQALIDRWGGKAKAIGRKAEPGPLYGISGDIWSALAVAVTQAELEDQILLASR